MQNATGRENHRTNEENMPENEERAAEIRTARSLSPAEMDSKCGRLCLAGHGEFHGRHNFAVKLDGHLILANKLNRVGELDLAAVNREALRCK